MAISDAEKRKIKRDYDAVWALPRGTLTTCPMCQKPFTKRQDRQGACSKDPCGNAYTKAFRKERPKGIGFQKAPYVHATDLLMRAW